MSDISTCGRLTLWLDDNKYVFGIDDLEKVIKYNSHMALVEKGESHCFRFDDVQPKRVKTVKRPTFAFLANGKYYAVPQKRFAEFKDKLCKMITGEDVEVGVGLRLKRSWGNFTITGLAPEESEVA